MKRGLVKIVFEYGERYTAEIAVPDDQCLTDHKQWSNLRKWWLFGGSDKTLVSWDDGSETLLMRNRIMSITMEPREARVLEIK